MTNKKINEEGEGLTAPGSVPGMGEPVLASRGVVGSGDVPMSARRKKKKKKHIREFATFESVNESTEWLENFDATKYIIDNMPMRLLKFSGDDIDHVAHCLNLLIDEYDGRPSNDDFIEQIAKEDYMKALNYADNANMLCLRVYQLFQVNKVPIGVRDKFRK